MAGRHFLIVRLAGIGDVVMASAAARRLRQTHPAARITWLCGSIAEPLVRRFADVDDVVSIDESRLLTGSSSQRLRTLLPLWRRLVRLKITDVLLLHFDRRYRILTAPLLRAGVMVTVRGDFVLPGRYFGDEYGRFADQVGHVGPLPDRYELGLFRGSPPMVAGERRRVALVPGGARNALRESALKRWPVEHYAAVARALAADNEVLLVGDAHDAWVRPHFAGIPVRDLLGTTTLPETVDLFASCDLVVAHDTGPMHLARLARAPVLALFGPTMPSQFAPEDSRTTTLWGGADLACRPCYDGREFAKCADNICMAGISPEIVIRTARTILGRRTSAIAAP